MANDSPPSASHSPRGEGSGSAPRSDWSPSRRLGNPQIPPARERSTWTGSAFADRTVEPARVRVLVGTQGELPERTQSIIYRRGRREKQKPQRTQRREVNSASSAAVTL